MGVYALKRAVWAGVLFLGLSTVTFVIFFVLPHVDPGRRRRRLGFTPPSPLHVDQHQSVAHEYGQYMWKLFHGSLGRSSSTGQDVLTIVTNVTPATASLVLGGALIWMVIAVPLGLLSALRPRSRTGRTVGAVFLVGMCAQPLWLGLVLSWLFGVRLGWLPPGGYCDALGPEPDCGGPIPWTQHMALPWLPSRFCSPGSTRGRSARTRPTSSAAATSRRPGRRVLPTGRCCARTCSQPA